ncbi:MAG: hypothetical protein E5Y52_04715 [Mesorhizobium sp.]|nr:MAG: hypothetical protein E5Y52_04715 [Mesorhizobium sp.]
MRPTCYSGVYWPADLGMLQRVFDRLCEERRLARKDREQREYLARELFQVFDDGINEEATFCEHYPSGDGSTEYRRPGLRGVGGRLERDRPGLLPRYEPGQMRIIPRYAATDINIF